MFSERIGKFLAIETDFPGKDSVLFNNPTVEFRARRVVVARQSGEGKWAVVIQLNEIRMTRGAVLYVRIIRCAHVLDQKLPVRVEKRLHFLRQRIHRAIGHQAVGSFVPGKKRRQREEQNPHRQNHGALQRTAHYRSLSLSASALILASESWLWRRP